MGNVIARKPYDSFTLAVHECRRSSRVDESRPMDIPPISASPAPASDSRPARSEAAARAAAEAFEAAFLAEMLKYTGMNSQPDGFGGGAGEEAFSSFLTEEYARLMAARGGIGLAEQVFEILKQR
jgi:Rod binding domain-containing protein